MITFIVKWALASTPAFLIIFLPFVVLGLLFGGLFSACWVPGVAG